MPSFLRLSDYCTGSCPPNKELGWIDDDGMMQIIGRDFSCVVVGARCVSSNFSL